MNHNLLLITKDKIYLYSHTDNKILNIDEPVMWIESNLEQVISQLLAKFKSKNWGVLLNNDLNYVISFTIDKPQKPAEEKALIRQKVIEKIPEYSDRLVWDYKIVKDKGFCRVQVAASEKSFIEHIYTAFEKSKITPSFIEPMSYFLSQGVTKSDQYYVIFYSSPYESIIALANNGFINMVTTLNNENLESQINKFFEFIKIKIPMSFPIEMLVSDNNKVLNEQLVSFLEKSNTKITAIDLTPFLFKDYAEIKSRNDEAKLNLNHDESSEIEDIQQKIDVPKDPQKTSKRKKLLSIIAIVVMFLVMAGALTYYFTKEDKTKKSANNVTAVIPTPTPVSTTSNENEIDEKEQETIDSKVVERPNALENFKGYRIDILNGSGIPGEADKLRDLIIPLQFDRVNLGNADKFDYSDTTVQFKSEEVKLGQDLLQDILIDYSVVVLEEYLPASSIYDVQIVIGSTRNPVVTPTENDLESSDSGVQGIQP
ncbi:MAG: LytR protein [Patescibacteria group bacterium]|nr:LytR protein [Patescibacteria group bacterium]